jgi:serine/threonine protein kinase/tetratricopeptide (TPR) repeat protein
MLAEHDRASGLLATGPSIIHPDRFMLSPGDCLAGRFEIIRPLGAGGMGEVYEAHDRELGARVALKTLRPELVHDAKNRERFKHEILNGRKVTHRNICRIYDLAPDYANERACLAFTMELLEGETLAAYLERQPDKRLSVDEALPLVRQMAAGLEALHEQDIVHRDFKPGNVILVRQGDSTQVRISDFGLALRAEDSGPALSGSKDIVGTPIYMAPEQLTGERAKVSPATDVYALGLVLYEMVTATRAYPAETLAENILQKTQGPPVPPRERVPDLDENWNSTILRCLEKEPEDRPKSPGEVLRALEGEVVLPMPLAPAPRKRAPSPKRAEASTFADPRIRWLTLAAAIAVFLVLSGTLLRFSLVEDDRQAHIAVLPFTAIGGDPEFQVFADGLMGTVTQRLSQFEGLNEQLLVVPTSMVLGEGVRTAPEALGKFGANYAVEGNLQSQDGRLRLTLTVVDAERGRQVGTEIVEGNRTNALSIQDGAVAKLADLLNLVVQPRHVSDYVESSPVTPGAHQFYLQGQGYLQRRDQLEKIDNAITLFKQAIETDSTYALAYAGLGEAYWFKYLRTSDSVWVDRALENCTRAVSLNDQLSHVHVTMGRVLHGTGKHREAVDEFKRALALDQRNSGALQGLGNAYESLGRNAEAESTYLAAVNRRKDDWAAYKEMGLFYYRRGEFGKAIHYFQQVVALTPDNAQAYANMGSFHYRLGDYDEARRMWERSIEIEPRHSALSNLGKLLSSQEKYAEAAARYEQAIELKPLDHRLWANLASVSRRAGELAKSREAGRKAIALVESALSVDPNRADLLSSLAHYTATTGEHQRAAELIEKALALKPSEPETLLGIAETCEQVGRREQAVSLARRAFAMGYPMESVVKDSNLGRLLRDPAYRGRFEKSGAGAQLEASPPRSKSHVH